MDFVALRATKSTEQLFLKALEDAMPVARFHGMVPPIFSKIEKIPAFDGRGSSLLHSPQRYNYCITYIDKVGVFCYKQRRSFKRLHAPQYGGQI